MSHDGEKKFELSVKALQGRWMHEPAGIMLIVRGTQVVFSTGEIYALERESKRQFECFGYVAQNDLCTASEIVWKNPETSEVVKWHFEGDEDAAYEVDTANILTGDRKRSRRSILDSLSSAPAAGAQPVEVESVQPVRKKHKISDSRPPQKKYVAAVNKGIGNFKDWLQVQAGKVSEGTSVLGELVLPEIADKHVAKRMEEFVSGHEGFTGKAAAKDGRLEISATRIGLEKALAKYDIVASRADILGDILASETLEKSRVLEILKELDGLAMTVDALKRTLLGVKVNKLAKSEESEIADLARQLVQKWKEVYRQETIVTGKQIASAK